MEFVWKSITQKYTFSVTNRKFNRQWIPENLLNRIDEKDKIWKKLIKKKKRTGKTDETLQEKYKLLKYKIKTDLRTEKLKYYKEKLKNSKNNIKQTWKICQEIEGIGKKELDSDLVKYFRKDLSIKERTNIINHFQRQQVTTMRNNRNIILKNTGIIDKKENTIAETIYLPMITKNKIGTYISQLDENKASGLDEVIAKHLKGASQNMTNMLYPYAR